MCKLRIKNLNYIYDKLSGSKFVLKIPDFELNTGDFLAIIGENGGGKSTFGRIIAGLLRPTSGNVYFDDADVFDFLSKTKQNRFCISMVFQFPEDQIFMENVYKDISFGLNNMGIPPEKIRDRVISALNFVGLGEDFCEKSTLDLSFGERRKVAIAEIIALNPKILILDEPTAGLDTFSSLSILRNIRDYVKMTNAIVILICHNLEQILEFSNKVLIINNGNGIFFDSTEKFLDFSNLKETGIPLPKHLEILEVLNKKGYKINLNNIVDPKKAAKSVMDFIKNKQGISKEC